MEMAGARVSNATRCTEKTEKRLFQGDLAKTSGERDEGMRADLGNHHQTGRKPTAVALSCGSHMCQLRHEEG